MIVCIQTTLPKSTMIEHKVGDIVFGQHFEGYIFGVIIEIRNKGDTYQYVVQWTTEDYTWTHSYREIEHMKTLYKSYMQNEKD